jgi:hypothetical protein
MLNTIILTFRVLHKFRGDSKLPTTLKNEGKRPVHTMIHDLALCRILYY